MTPANGEGPRIGPFGTTYEYADTEPDSPRGPYTAALPRDDIPFKPGFTDHLAHYSARLRFLVVRYDNTWTRSAVRFASGLTAGAPGLAGLIQMPDAAAGDDRLICLGIMAVSTIALVWLLRRNWFNAGRGMLFGAWLWLLSGLWVNGITTVALSVWQYVMPDDSEASDLSDLIICVVIGAALLIGASLALKKYDPDY